MLPADVVAKTKLCILDSIGTMLAGATTELGASVYRAAARFETAAFRRALGLQRARLPPSAALVNGTLSRDFRAAGRMALRQ